MTRVRMAMVGGGAGAFIGGVHRMAARLDDCVELVAGAFQSDPAESVAFGTSLGLPNERCYGDYAALLRGESALPANVRAQFIAIVTPNHLHVPIAAAALQAGFHVLSDKPAALNLAEAKLLAAYVQSSRQLYGLTQTYLGYPLVRQARAMVADGRLGAVHRVMVEYPQGWLATPLETTGNKQATWRTDPATSGASGCFGDIGTHAHNLATFITAARVTRVSARLRTVVPGRKLDDEGDARFELAGGIWGNLFASQVAAGHINDLAIRVFGDRASLEWRQELPNQLSVKHVAGPTEIFSAGSNMPGLVAEVATRFRTPGGHPEGYIEAFADLYRDFAEAVGNWRADSPATFEPGIDAGFQGIAFVDACLASNANGGAWQKVIDFGENGHEDD